MSRLGLRIENDPRLSLGDLVDIVQLAEQRGFESVWVPESGGRDALTLLATLAQTTQHIKLGTGILPIYGRTPMTIAMSAVGLAFASGNRFLLGLGTGHKSTVEDLHGVSYGRPMSRMRETVEIISNLLNGETVTTNGQNFTTRNARLGKSVQGAKVPMYIAALGPKMVALTGELADGILLNWTAWQCLDTVISQVKNAAKSRIHNRPTVDIAGYVRVAVGGDESTARRELQKQISRYASLPHYRDFFESSGFSEEMRSAQAALAKGDSEMASSCISEEMQNSVAIIGPAEHCIKEIERRRSLGLQLPVVAPFAIDGNAKQTYTRTIEAFNE